MPITTGSIPKAIQPSSKKPKKMGNNELPRLQTLRDAIVETKKPKGGKK